MKKSGGEVKITTAKRRKNLKKGKKVENLRRVTIFLLAEAHKSISFGRKMWQG